MKHYLLAILVFAAACGDNKPDNPDEIPTETVIDTLHPQPPVDSGSIKDSNNHVPPAGRTDSLAKNQPSGASTQSGSALPPRGIPTRETRVIAVSNSDNQPQTPTALEVIRESPAPLQPAEKVEVGNLKPAELIRFAKTLQGVPYKYASTDPTVGFDCSGFITYVFNHFSIRVPRSSVDFTNVGKQVQREKAKPGDLVLFTGTDSSIRIVGHMGIITDNDNGALQFIHSTSGKAYGVTITPLNSYYDGRFVKVIRIFPS
ncbi:C40 family peptidase [Flavihumibacter sp. ZG627]|uniref:C40 family peptidase n=1 Tax=Flavihumibacter sp. ZG627 TaxID=1463156 RepID=UPI000694FD47|nr:C40 family peptidase [Flavihumibacter sp. ZG627]